MRGLLLDVTQAASSLRRQPVSTSIIIVMLALGIGASTSLFGVVNGVLLRSLPYPRPDELVVVWETLEANAEWSVSPANYLDWKRSASTLGRVAAYTYGTANLEADGEPEALKAAIVTPDFFDVFKLPPVLGNIFSGDGDSSDARVAVLSHGLWTRRFGGSPGIVGRAIPIDGAPVVVLGVMPPQMEFPGAVDLWLRAPRRIPEPPIPFSGELSELRSGRYLGVVGRLKPDVSVERARVELASLARRLADQYPADDRGWGANVVGLHEQIVGRAEPTLALLAGATLLLLIIASANAAGLLLARAIIRRRETALLKALGASDLRVLRGLLFESVSLAGLGAALGWGLAWVATRVVIGLAPETIPRLEQVTLDHRVFLFTAALALVVGVSFGIVPAAVSMRAAPAEGLVDSARMSAGHTHRRTRDLFVTVQIALTLALLSGTGLLLRSLQELRAVRLGFDPDDIVTFTVSPLPHAYPSDAQVTGLYRRLLDALSTTAGVESASLTLTPPLSGASLTRTLQIDGTESSPDKPAPSAGFQTVGPAYFRTMHIPLLRGREFSAADTGQEPVAIVSEALARTYWPNRDVLGARLRLEDEQRERAEKEPSRWMTVVGVVADVRHDDLKTGPRSELYIPYTQEMWPTMTFVARAVASSTDLRGALHQAVRQVDRNQPISDFRSMASFVDRSLRIPRLTLFIVGAFGSIALFLAAFGVYASMAYSVSQRMTEIGIRMALGATRASIFTVVVREAAVVVAAGVAVGLATVLTLSSAAAHVLYAVSPADPVAYVSAVATLVAVSLAAAASIAWRATKADPISALRLGQQ